LKSVRKYIVVKEIYISDEIVNIDGMFTMKLDLTA
jgi:hypothetical protein